MSLNLNQLKSKRPAATSVVAAPPVLHARLDACTLALSGLGEGFKCESRRHAALLLLDQLITSAVSRWACFLGGGARVLTPE